MIRNVLVIKGENLSFNDIGYNCKIITLIELS